jgi:hypothetical protein
VRRPETGWWVARRSCVTYAHKFFSPRRRLTDEHFGGFSQAKCSLVPSK